MISEEYIVLLSQVSVPLMMSISDDTVLAAYYRPTKHDEKYLETVYKDFTHLKQLTKNGNIWIAGDFNLPDIDLNWGVMLVPSPRCYPV
jgi:hypothetical protein